MQEEIDIRTVMNSIESKKKIIRLNQERLNNATNDEDKAFFQSRIDEKNKEIRRLEQDLTDMQENRT